MTDSQPSFLYVEDDAFSREVMQMILERLMGNSQIYLFDDSVDFIKRLKALPVIPDMIFLDIQLAPLDGFEMLKLIRQESAYNASKVIALTASIMPSDVTHFRQVGFDGLIGKPLVHKVFPELVRRLLAGERLWYIP